MRDMFSCELHNVFFTPIDLAHYSVHKSIKIQLPKNK